MITAVHFESFGVFWKEQFDCKFVSRCEDNYRSRYFKFCIPSLPYTIMSSPEERIIGSVVY